MKDTVSFEAVTRNTMEDCYSGLHFVSTATSKSDYRGSLFSTLFDFRRIPGFDFVKYKLIEYLNSMVLSYGFFFDLSPYVHINAVPKVWKGIIYIKKF